MLSGMSTQKVAAGMLTRTVLILRDLTRGNRRKAAQPQIADFTIPKESISQFELRIFKAHFLSIPTAANRMMLSGLFMQATCGPNTSEEPPRAYPIEHAHWVAWKSHGNMSREDAEEEYIDLVKDVIKKAQHLSTDFNTYGQ